MLTKLGHSVLPKLYLVAFERVSLDSFHSEVMSSETHGGLQLIYFKAMDSK